MGNRITAIRWAKLFRELGYPTVILNEYDRERCDALIALHAVKSFASVARYRTMHPQLRIAIAITGTDVAGDPTVFRKCLELSDRVITLQSATASILPRNVRSKVRVIEQSFAAPRLLPVPLVGTFDVCVIGHLRDVKDPFLLARALRLLPEQSKIRGQHIGGILTPDMRLEAIEQMRAVPRYRWFGELPRHRTIRAMARCRLLVVTSKSEGGPSVVSEALACGVPILSTRVTGVTGILGNDYPGLYDVGDAVALADLLRRSETDAAFYESLTRACTARKYLVSPTRERATWKTLFDEWWRSGE